MLCLACKTLGFFEKKSICKMCKKENFIHPHIICAACSESKQQCAVCLKKVVGKLSKIRYSNGCPSCGG